MTLAPSYHMRYDGAVPKQYALRLPNELFDVIAERADRNGVSVNTMCVALLAGGVGFKLDPNDPAAKAAHEPHTRPPRRR